MCAIHRKINETSDITGFLNVLGNRPRQDSDFALNTDRAEASFVQRPAGWRWDWVIQGLSSDETNYTAWVMEPGDTNRGTIFGPINLVTKEGRSASKLICTLISS